MKKTKLFAVLFTIGILFFAALPVLAQNCSLQFTFSATESRCMATGSVTINARNGSGTYYYRVSGPINTNFTTSNVITGLSAGKYSVVVRDASTGCEVQENMNIGGSYNDPRFKLSKTDVTCAGKDGTITAIDQKSGRSPFTYTIVAPSPAEVGTSNTTGVFTGLQSGEYAVELRDSCGGIQVRRVTIEDYHWWYEWVQVVRANCDSATATVFLKDNKGTTNNTNAFGSFRYGVANAPGDTTWFNSRNFTFTLGKRRFVTFVAKDDCGNARTSFWTVPDNERPAANVTMSNYTCSQFTASVTGQQNLTNPQYRLFNNSNVLVSSNALGVFNNLAYGTYCLSITDACYDTIIQRCFTVGKPEVAVSSSIGISNRNCTTFTATAAGQANLTYTLFDSSNIEKATNTTGVFPNLAYGSYCIKVRSACADTVVTRCFTERKPLPVLDIRTLNGFTCTGFDAKIEGQYLTNAEYCLYDSAGNRISCSNSNTFTNLPYGSYCVRAISCGDTSNTLCFTGGKPAPVAPSAVQTSNIACSTFTASLTVQSNIGSLEYCLYDAASRLLRCNNNGTFDSIPFGSYCIRVKSTCYDTTITRCFTQTKPKPTVNTIMQQLNSVCNSFTARIVGTNLFDPVYTLYNGNNNSVVATNSTGVFDNLPYGTYCATVKDGCYDTTIRVCQTFSFNYRINVVASKSCNIGSTNIDLSIFNGISPFVVNVYHPNGRLIYTDTSSNDRLTIELPQLDANHRYRLTAADKCGRSATTTVSPDPTLISKSITAKGKCPGSIWPNGSGDLNVTCSSNLYPVSPAIIKKDGNNVNINFSSSTGNSYVFSDLEPATYIVAYTMQTCNTKVYDTFTLRPYAYPRQGQSAIYQCNNSSFSLSADVSGGISPYNFQIIGSMPETPSIASAPQTSPLFTINNGTNYSLVRLRTIDGCGNATLSDISVLPLQNISIKSNSTCLYQNVTLTVDTIPNGVYSWYKKFSDFDSVLVANTQSYNIPFMRTSDIGTYVSKVSVNNDCVTRLSQFFLSGNCGYSFLPVALQLHAKTTGGTHQLGWKVTEAQTVATYEVERKLSNEASFTTIATLKAENNKQDYLFAHAAQAGTVQYRIKAVSANGSVTYSNVITLKSEGAAINIYPNPVTDKCIITFNGTRPCQYRIEWHNMAGQVIDRIELNNITQSTYIYKRSKGVANGMYLLQITNITTGTTENHKIMFR